MMRARRNTGLLLVGGFLLVSLVLYVSLENASQRRRMQIEKVLDNMQKVDGKLTDLELSLNRNDQLLKNAERQFNSQQGAFANEKKQVDEPPKPGKQITKPTDPPFVQEPDVGDQCLIARQRQNPDTKVQMLDAYKEIPFDNPDGGKWKQGWDVQYSASSVTEKKLEVIVIPHSHCDPGWLMTFEEYYKQQVKNILDGMVKYLSEFDDMRFIYAEISFFERWWTEQSPRTRALVKDYLKTNKLEIVTGGWVMTDEANAHYANMIDQLIEGHEFLRLELDYRPRSHWSIDPFGLSSTMPHILKSANFSHMAIQRVHYSVKKYLAKSRQLEFKWRQLWAASSAHTDILTHMFPFYSYDVPHTCGPDPGVCCQFDFKRMKGGGGYCPWGQTPQETTDLNVATRAALLADQYRKKSELYASRALLVPLGDDFRYDTDFEWQKQRSNYQRLFNHMNNDPSLNIHARFGTLSDYFELMKKELIDPPTLSGDFFTYADRDDHYWSGYFTSRPHYKRMDRQLMHTLRSAELAFSYALSLASSSKQPAFATELRPKITHARRQLALFQHHDGITGTARDPVVNDYAKRMMEALNECREVIAVCAEFILRLNRDSILSTLSVQSTMLKATTVRPTIDDLDIESKIPNAVDKTRHLIVQNTLSFHRTDVHCIHTESADVSIKHQGSDTFLQLQIEPVFKLTGALITHIPNEYKVCFILNIKPMSFVSLELIHRSSFDKTNSVMAKIHLDSSKITIPPNITFEVVPLDMNSEYTMKNDKVTAVLRPTDGYLKMINGKSIGMQFVKYGARTRGSSMVQGADNPPGAYLFLPGGPAEPIESAGTGHQVIFTEGPIISHWKVAVGSMVDHTVSLCHDTETLCSRSVTVENIADIRERMDYELAMRLYSDIASGSTFYTDLNSMQMLRRERLDKLPIQANTYPTTSAAFIEDSTTRLTLLTAQPAGASSHESGCIEVMLDRRLSQDDGRGVSQGCKDNRPTQSLISIVIEDVQQKPDATAKVAFHSKLAYVTSLSMQHPINTIFSTSTFDANAAQELETSMSLLTDALPCDTHVVNMRVRDSTTALLVLHRTILQCGGDDQNVPIKCPANGQVSSSLFGNGISFARELTLSGMYTKRDTVQGAIQLEPMALHTYEIELGI